MTTLMTMEQAAEVGIPPDWPTTDGDGGSSPCWGSPS